ncbi:hypothetical protein AABM34_00255 [Lysinibacillus fusiformis]
MPSKRNIARTSLTWVILIAVLTAIGSEIKIMPFANTTFRFGLGTIIFFLCTLIKPTPIILAGFATSIVTIIFRVFNSYLHDIPVLESIFNHLPAGLFYVLFAICLQILDVQTYREKPLKLGLLVAFSEVISNLAEQIFRFFVQTYTFLFLHDLLILLAVLYYEAFL